MPLHEDWPARCTTPHDNGNLPFPSPDALQEFGVATGRSRRFDGDALGASVNAVTKSGANRFHGNGFEFLRDSRFTLRARSPRWERTVRRRPTDRTAASSYGNEAAMGIGGPGFWNVDTALARVLQVSGGRTF